MHNEFVISWLQIMWRDKPIEEKYAGFVEELLQKKAGLKSGLMWWLFDLHTRLSAAVWAQEEDIFSAWTGCHHHAF